MSQEISEKVFRVGVSPRLFVDNIRGSVVIRSMDVPKDETGEERLIKISAVKHLETGSAENTSIEMIQEADGCVIIKTLYQEKDWLSWFFSMHKPCKIDYMIQVPTDCDLEVKCVSSNAHIEGIKGDVTVKTVSGEVVLRYIQGRIRAASISGRIHGEALAGSAILDTVSGNIHLAECNLKRAEVKSISADLDFQTPLTQGPYRFKSVSGNAHLIVPPQTGCEVEYRHISGRFECELPVQHRSFRSGALSAQVQSGGPEVSFRTTSGKLQISLAQGWLPSRQGKNLSTENNHQILEKIIRGELSAEEGLKVLQ